MFETYLYYIIFILVVILLAILVYCFIYVQYTKKINKVLQRKQRPGNYGSLDKKFFIVLISSIVVLIGVFLTIYFINNKKFSYNIPFYEKIEEFNIKEYEDNLKKIMKPKDDYVAIIDDFYIFTDKEGNIIDIKISLIVKKGKKYYSLKGTFDDDRNEINYKSGNITFSSEIINDYTKLTDYSRVFSRINFSDIWNFSEIEAENKFDLRFDFTLKNTIFYPLLKTERNLINTDGTIGNYDRKISGFLGIFEITTIEKLEGFKRLIRIDHYLLIP